MDKYYNIGNHHFRVTGNAFVEALEKLPEFTIFEDSTHENAEFTIEECVESTTQIPSFQKIIQTYKDELTDGVFGITANGYLTRQTFVDGASYHYWTIDKEKKVYIQSHSTPWTAKIVIMNCYELITADMGTLSIHSSCIVYKQQAILFLGKSGTGKSTHTQLWREYIPGSHLLNDDSPILRFEDGQLWAYGCPYSGKTPCYRQERFPIAGFVRLSQAPYNRITKQTTILHAYGTLLPSFPYIFQYKNELNNSLNTFIGKVISSIPVYCLECLPDKEAALLSFHTFFPDEIL